jgi:hypothetical protein
MWQAPLDDERIGGTIMRRHFSLSIFICLVLLSPTAALAAGDIYVGGPYGTKITSLPYTINAPGAYYLGGNLSCSASVGNGITINSDDVTLDLMGFTLTYTGSGTDNPGISMNTRTNVEVRNGTLRGWPGGGIREFGHGFLHRIMHIRTDGNFVSINLEGTGHLVQGCCCKDTSSEIYGENGGMIIGCTVNGGQISTNSGLIIGNMANDSPIYGGINATNSLIMGNEVANCTSGIYSSIAGSLIGNTVSTSSNSQTGIVSGSGSPILLDQNSILGPGTHYIGIIPVSRNNAGYP